MARVGVATSGKTLGSFEGFAGLRPADLWYRVRRTALTLVSISALIGGVAATAAVIKGAADSGVVPGNPGELVISVTPMGYGWTLGLRPGQVVDVLIKIDEPGGWHIRTHDAAGIYDADGPKADANLRETLPFGIGALIVGYLSVVFLRTRRRWVLPAAALAVLAASIPLQVEGAPLPSTVALGWAALLPAAAFTNRLGRWRWLHMAALATLVGLVAAWAVGRFGPADYFANAEVWRGRIAFFGTIALIVDRGLLPAMTGLKVARPKVFDVVIVAGLAAAIVIVSAIAGLDLLAIVLVVLFVLAVIPGTRQRLAGPIEHFLLGDVREQAAAEATEAERAKLARELHDVPLQELAAVIRRLEIVPGTETESENLRALAGHLRNVATELRPPVLDDLGLPAALDFLAEETTTLAIGVTAEVVDDTGFGEEHRPPTDVELAMYRIASEAVGNAVRHSGGTKVDIAARVAPDQVELVVRDDGAGLAATAPRDAAKRKRLGLASMRRRAEAIDAEFSIEGSARGTTVRVAWQA